MSSSRQTKALPKIALKQPQEDVVGTLGNNLRTAYIRRVLMVAALSLITTLP